MQNRMYPIGHTLRNFFVWFVHTTGMTALYRRSIGRQGPLVRVVVFHDVPDTQWFEDVIEMLSREYNVITPMAFHQKKFKKNKINVLLTFDDGYKSWMTTCVPVLEKYKIQGLFFINSGLLDVAHDDSERAHFFENLVRISPKEALTWEDAKHLVRRGHTIGGHTVHHMNLAEAEPAVCQSEITKDKQKLETELGVVLKDFAYPFGTRKHYNTKVTEGVKSASYTHVYEAEPGFVSDVHYSSSLPRMCFEKDQPLGQIRSWIEGGYDVYFFLKRYVWN